ncbi:MAG: 50S ribosomal protein L3 [Nanoarchaeota archaeon]
MPKINQPRSGTLQYWPRKRINKFIPSVNWTAIPSNNVGLQGFIAYKVGMKSAFVKDNTADSLTKGKRIAIPVTILEAPTIKIFSVRFYKYGRVMTEVFSENTDKELRKKVKIPKVYKKNIDDVKDFDDIRVLVYSQVKKTGLKKSPDIAEIALGGNVEEKLKFVKEHIGKEIFVKDIFKKNSLIDVRGLTKGKGLQGPVKRFGISLKFHKSEKGQRRPGSLGPWHPSRVARFAPQAGQLGMFTRNFYNLKIVDLGNNPELFKNIHKYGNVRNDYLIVSGSVPGPAKRQLLITAPLRKTKKQEKKNYELVDIR